MRRQNNITRTIYLHTIALFNVDESGNPTTERKDIYLAEAEPLDKREIAKLYPDYVGGKTLSVVPKKVIITIEKAVKNGVLEDTENA